MEREGLRVVADVRARYDGRRRSPFDEAECGHHYARAMASWTTVLAWTGFGWSGVTGTMRFAARPGRHFWSNGSAWGTCELRRAGRGWRAALRVAEGRLALRRFELADGAARAWPRPRTLGPGAVAHFGAAPPPAGPRDAGRGRRHQA
jgi:hypothetical protein